MRQPVWFACGDTGLLLDFSGYGPSFGLPPLATDVRAQLTRNARLLGQMVRQHVDENTICGITDIVPGLCSILFHYDPLLTSAADIKAMVSLFLDRLDEAADTRQNCGDCRFVMAARLAPILTRSQSGPNW